MRRRRGALPREGAPRSRKFHESSVRRFESGLVWTGDRIVDGAQAIEDSATKAAQWVNGRVQAADEGLGEFADDVYQHASMACRTVLTARFKFYTFAHGTCIAWEGS